VVRAGLGLMIFGSAVLGFYNIVRSLFFKAGETA
jgi:cytochrome c oxidase cbb3-type subunit 1